MTCRYCLQPIIGREIATVYAYWNMGGQWFAVHPECKDAGWKAEVLECQTIDADCNDCRHFKRGEVEKRWLSCMEDKKPSTRLVNMGFIRGHCLKFDKPTIAQPNKWTGHECFEHRRRPDSGKAADVERHSKADVRVVDSTGLAKACDDAAALPPKPSNAAESTPSKMERGMDEQDPDVSNSRHHRERRP